MKLQGLLCCCALFAAVSFLAPADSHANACNLAGCVNTTVHVKSGTGNTCTGTNAGCDCNAFAQAQHPGNIGSCVNGTTCTTTYHGTVIDSCNNGTACCSYVGRDESAESATDSVSDDISTAMSGSEVAPMTASYWGSPISRA